MLDLGPYVAKIERKFSLKVHSFSLLAGGQNCITLLVNAEYVFRFPKAASVALERELFLLQALDGQLPLATPRPAFIDLAADLPVCGYRSLPGSTLSRDRLARMSPGEQKTIAHQLAQFLVELHAPATLRKIGRDFPVGDTKTSVEALFEQTRTKVFPLAGPKARRQLTDHFETYLAKDEPFSPVLRHGDFGPGNILVLDGPVRISGIIDFGSCCLGDPAYDLAGLSVYGREFMAHVAEVYPGLNEMAPRIEFYRGTFALQELLIALDQNDATTVTACLAAFRE